MGQPVRIADLAAQMIRLSGLTPDVDVPIRYTGLRPGEKLYEELWTDGERPVATAHPGILQAPGDEGLDANEQRQLENLLRAAGERDRDGCWRYLLRLVPTFQGRVADEAAIPPDRPVPAKVVPFPEQPVRRGDGPCRPAVPPGPATRSATGTEVRPHVRPPNAEYPCVRGRCPLSFRSARPGREAIPPLASACYFVAGRHSLTAEFEILPV